MTAQAQILHEGESIGFTADQAYNAGDVIQMPDGRAGVVATQVDSGKLGAAWVRGVALVQKTTSMVLLKGGKVFWDYSANLCYFRKINDQDFYLGRCNGDAASTDTSVTITLNDYVDYDIDLARDSYVTAAVGTAAAGGFGDIRRRGGAFEFVLTSTNEAQKLDALSLDGFAVGANAIVEMAFCQPAADGGASGVISLGIASGTHATTATSITNYCLCKILGNSTAIYFESTDGTTTVAATDSTKTLTIGQSNAAGVRKEIWIDTRNPASVAIYVDAVQVLTGTTFVLTAVGATTLKLLAHVAKASSTDTVEFQVDWLRARFAHQ